MRTTSGRFAKGAASVAVLLALGACGSDGGDSNPFSPTPNDGTTGNDTGIDLGGSAGGTDTGGGFGTGGGTGTGGGVTEVEFDCNGSTFIVGPGDSIDCNGERFTVDASGNVLDSAGNVVQGGGDGTGGGLRPPSNEGGTLSDQLRTRFVSGEDFDLWLCQAEGEFPTVGYLFPNESQGAFIVIEDGGIIGGADFDYTVNSANSVLLDYPEQGVQEEITNISFSGGDFWSGFSNTDGNLSCQIASTS